jgi:hypothetical protein
MSRYADSSGDGTTTSLALCATVSLTLLICFAVPARAVAACVSPPKSSTLTVEPSAVTIAPTRRWGPFSKDLYVSGRRTIVWVHSKTTAPGSPVTTLATSDQGKRVMVALCIDAMDDHSAHPPRGARGATLRADGELDPGSYHGVLDLPGGQHVMVKVLVQDSMGIPILAVLLGALTGWGVRRSFNNRLAQPQPELGVAKHLSRIKLGVPRVAALSAMASGFLYVAGVYGGHTFGQWSDYMAAFATGLVAHLVGGHAIASFRADEAAANSHPPVASRVGSWTPGRRR